MRAGVVFAFTLLARAEAPKQAAPPTTAQRDAGCIFVSSERGSEWNASLHRVAFTDRDFQTSYAIEPVKFCADCHLAAADGCATCHGAGSGHGAEDPGSAASCHEFEFSLPHAEQMQPTCREHAASPFADVMACYVLPHGARAGRAS